MKLEEYIDKHHKGCKAAFARSQGVRPQAITPWVKNGFIVVNGYIYSPRRKIKGINDDNKDQPE